MSENSIDPVCEDNDHIIEYLKNSRLFEHVPDDLLQQLAPLSEFVYFSPGDEILKEGDINDKVFFLLRGILAISSNGEIIAHLRRSGDIFGEMSIISSNPCSATVTAETQVSAFSVRAKDIGQYTDVSAEMLQNILYRIFAKILAEKLSLTNHKAHQFERTLRHLNKAKEDLQKINDELEKKVAERTRDLQQRTVELEESYRELEQQNTTLLASHRKLEDLNGTKEQLLKQIGTLRESHLSQLQNKLEDALEFVDIKSKNALVEAAREAHQIDEILRPITSLYFTQKAIQSKRVLLAENVRKQQIIAKMALRGTGMALDIVSDIEEGRKHLEKQNYDIICINPDLIELAQIAHEMYPEIKSVFITEEDVEEYLSVLRQYPFLSNVVSRHKNDQTFTIKNIITTVSKLVGDDLFGLEKYLSWGVDVQQCPVISSTEREALVDKMDHYFNQLGVRGKVLRRAVIVAEELLMNAIYDAPLDAKGKPLYNHLPRTELVVLKKEERGLLRYACDGTLLAISVQDPFGALTRETILEYLGKRYQGEHESISGEKGGAGLGLFQIMETSNLLVINVKPGIRTEVIALFDMDPLHYKSDETTSLHFFYG